MDIQLFVVAGLFAIALFFMIRRVVLQMRGKKTTGCEKCEIAEKK